MAKEFDKSAATFRRKLEGYSGTINLIKDWGKKAYGDMTDKESVAYFRGMIKNLESNYSKFEEIWQELEDLQDQGASSIPSSTDTELRKSTQRAYFGANKYIQLLQMSEEEAAKVASSTAFGGTSFTGEHKVARSLPKLALPTFSGLHADWPSYRDTFVSLVDTDPMMAPVSKLHYLRASLTGPAFSLISHLSISDLNYAIAWKIIKDNYDNKRLLAATYLDKILAAKPSSGKATSESFKTFLSNVGDSVAGLKLLAIPEQHEFILFHLSARALDTTTREQFEIANKDVEFPSVDSLIQFVRDRSTSLLLANAGATAPETNNTQHGKYSKTTKTPNPKNFPKTLLTQDQKSPKKQNSSPSTNHASPTKHPPCFICKINHHLLSCEKFHVASPEEKWQLIRGWDGCINCLNANHSVRACPSTWKCRFCPERHHSSLHRSLPPPKTTSELTHTLSSTSQEDSQVILGTAVVEIQDARGQFQRIRVVVDSGSQNSFITHRCATKLGLTIQHLRKRISGIGETPYEGMKGKATCLIRPRLHPMPCLQTEAIVIPNITSFLPSKALSPQFVGRCYGFNLADPGFWKPSAIDFLVGADLFSQIMTGSAVPIKDSNASLFSSIFGYIILGKVNGEPGETTSALFAMTSEDDLNLQLKRFWEIEEPGPTQTFRNPDDEYAEKHFQRTHRRQADGRYVVQLPFKADPPTVGDSTFVAQRRFLNLERKLESNQELKRSYHETINEYLALDHMTSASQPTKFIIPHHAIVKQEQDAFKVRVVFDASVPVPGGSLNQHLLVGEKLQRDIKDVLLSFRRHQVVFSTDVVKMFRMIVVDQQDRGFLQIFWRSTEGEDLQLLELKTLPFGLVSSPFLALRVLKQLTLDHGNEYPLAAQTLQRDIYVDDILGGAASEGEALELKRQLVLLLQKGGFSLSKWTSNSKTILDSVEEDNTKTVVALSDKDDYWVKLLGLQWDPFDDAFLFAFQPPTRTYTKRGILSSVARLYDPLGFLTPVTMMMKSIVQELWKLGLSWDSLIPTSIQTLWDSIITELNLLSSVRVPRCLQANKHFEWQVVGFADASLKGYAAVLYFRVNIPDQGWHVSFLSSKSKLAPTKSLSIPRLELSGALLLAQLYNANQEFFNSLVAPSQPPIFHTDSSIVLGWLNTPTFKLHTFVANRVAKVLEWTPSGSWRHVLSEENPADAASRGLLPSQLLTDDLWWKGPPWLLQDQADWPSSSFQLTLELPEVKSSSFALVARSVTNPWLNWMGKQSAFLRIVRVIAWVKRWSYRVRQMVCHCGDRHSGPLKLCEIDAALENCVKWVQEQHFIRGRPFEDVAQELAKLQPFVDAKGVLRVGGRLKKADIHDTQKHPILLPNENHFTRLMVDYYHKVYLHPGPNLLQAIIQKNYWVPSLRRLVRARGFLCKTCYRSKAKAAIPLMGDLPTYRVNGGRAFLHVGVDFAGPFSMRESLRRKAPISKVYLCLFVCMATKALHLETVTRLTTDAFLAALDRFVSRRGIPSDIYSDRGSNFIGAAHYLTEVHRWFRSHDTAEGLENYASQRHIKWHFNPPLTPHMGGIWEAGIKSVKGHLFKVAGDHVLTFEELSTLFAKIEAILNSRPICPLSSHPDENDYLSPGHFLVGGPLVAVPEPSLLDLKENLLDRWQLISAMGQRFWRRWRNEYLATLQLRPKWFKRTENLQVGDLVLLKEETHPLSWPLAKVLEVTPGDDGIVRVATVKTSKSTFQRPVVKLIPLRPLLAHSSGDSSII